MKKRTSSAFADALNLLSISKYMQKSTYQHDISQIKDVLLKDQRTDQEISALYEFIYSFIYIQKIKSKYNEQFVKEICRYIYYKQVAQNTIIHTHKTVFLVLSGRVQVTYFEDNDSQRKESQQEQTYGSSFNEYGLSENKKCQAKTLRPSELACFDIKIFNELSSNQKSTDAFEKQSFLKSLSFCQIFSDLEIKYLSYHLETAFAQKNTFLYFENDTEIDYFYFIAKGEIEIFRGDPQGKLIQLTGLVDGEFFGEEGFFSTTSRQFAAKCNLNNSKLYRIPFQELDKRLWKQESRKILFDLLSQKWIYRYQRFCEQAQITFDKDYIQNQIKQLNSKLNCVSNCKVDIQYGQNQNNQEEQYQTVDDVYVSASWLMKSAQQAQNVLQNFEPKLSSNDDIKLITTVSPKFKLQLEKLKDLQKKQPPLSTNRTSKLQSSSAHRQVSVYSNDHKKVASNMNYLKYYNSDQERQPLEQQLKQFLGKIDIKDENICWGDDGSLKDREERINKFYKTMSNYAKFQYFKNKNLQESKSQKARILEQEYQQLLKQQETNLKKIFEQQIKPKTDNMVKKEFFLNQLKKMQKRLKVLELIQKGQLQCKTNQFVNEEGDIIDIEDQDKPDDAFDIINGKKVRKFNFVTSEAYESQKKHKIDDFKTQIDQQKQKIIVIEEIVKGKLSPQAAIDVEISMSSSLKKIDNNRLRPPSVKLIPQFITEQRRQSQSFKNEILKCQTGTLILSKCKIK